MKRKRPEPALKQTNLFQYFKTPPTARPTTSPCSPDVIPCSPLQSKARRRLSVDTAKSKKNSPASDDVKLKPTKIKRIETGPITKKPKIALSSPDDVSLDQRPAGHPSISCKTKNHDVISSRNDNDSVESPPLRDVRNVARMRSPTIEINSQGKENVGILRISPTDFVNLDESLFESDCPDKFVHAISQISRDLINNDCGAILAKERLSPSNSQNSSKSEPLTQNKKSLLDTDISAKCEAPTENGGKLMLCTKNSANSKAPTENGGELMLCTKNSANSKAPTENGGKSVLDTDISARCEAPTENNGKLTLCTKNSANSKAPTENGGKSVLDTDISARCEAPTENNGKLTLCTKNSANSKAPTHTTKGASASISVLPDLLADDFDSAFFDCSPTFSELQDIEDLREIDLSTCVRCIVTSIEQCGSEALFGVHIEGQRRVQEVLVLRDMWAYIEVSTGDVIGVKATREAKRWVVNATMGYVSIHPDILVTSTQLTGSMFCRRRGVLAHDFRGIDPSNKVMTIGCIVHELFQWALLHGTTTTEVSLAEQLESVLTTPSFIRMLWASRVSTHDARLDAAAYIPHIIGFVQRYLTKGELSTDKNAVFSGKITRVAAIEDNLVSRLVGLKGRVDVTVEVELTGTSQLGSRKMPLELKTGRASHSAEHRTQLVIYTLIMSLQAMKVDSGLLVYLKDGFHMTQITPSHAEIRDTLLLRNQLAVHLRHNHIQLHALPPPIWLPSACRKCPYNLVCRALLDEFTSADHPVRSAGPEVPPAHEEYVRRWVNLVGIMESDSQELTQLSLSSGQSPQRDNSQFIYSMNLLVDQNQAAGRLSEGFATFSLDASSLIVPVRVIEISGQTCRVQTETPLEPGTYTKMQTSLKSRYLSSLGMLLQPEHELIRRAFIDLVPPSSSGVPSDYLSRNDVMKALSYLNVEQQRAVLAVLSCDNYVLLEGPPGTGKTHTIAAIILVLVALGKSVLLASHTHSSVDNILLKLIKLKVNFVRLGSLSNIHSDVHPFTYAKKMENITDFAMEEMLSNSLVVATTCLGVDSDLIHNRKFDFSIIDEASQVTQVEAIRPLLCCNKFLLVGDVHQLGPVVRSQQATDLGASISAFQVFSRHTVHRLTQQYRMNSTIMALPNLLTYEGSLRCGSFDISNSTLKLTKSPTISWCEEVLSTALDKSVVIVDTSKSGATTDVGVDNECSNHVEVALVVCLVQQLLHCGLTDDQIGVTAPYRAQINLLSDALPALVEVKTVDQFQGRDKCCMIMSCTRMRAQQVGVDDLPSRRSQLLDDPRRLNVAITRAKQKLIIVGHVPTLKMYAPFAQLLDALPATAYVTPLPS